MGLNYNPSIVSEGLVYYLDLTNSRCYSGSGNTLTNLANGAIGITIVSGITYDTDYRKNLNFNGSSGYMTGNDTNLNFSTSDFTLQTTLKLNGLSNGFTGAYGSIICAGSALTNNSSIFYVSGTATSHYAVAIYHEPTLAINGRNFNFQTNKIYNLAVTKRYNVVEFFVDGSSIGTTTTSNNYNFTANGFTMGRWFASGVEQYLKGSIFDFRAYNRALSPEELQQNYFSQTKRYYNEENIVTNGLILNIDPSKSTSYSGVGNTIYDLSGVGNNGALINGPTFSSFNGGALVLDGSNDYVLVNNAADILSKTEYTKFIFFYVTSFSTNNNLISGGVSGLNHAFWLSGSNRLYAGHNGDWATFAGNTTLSLNTWYCGAVTYSNVSGWKLYLNGVLDGTNANTTTFNNFGELQIGAYANANLFTGRISLAMVYNRALSQQEISQNFNATRSRFGI
jgi:hypothetical protein